MRLPNITINDHVIQIPAVSYTNANKPSNPVLGDYYYQTDGITGLYKFTGLKWDHMGDSVQPANPWTVDYNNKKLIKSSFVGELEDLTGAARYYPEEDILLTDIWATIGVPSNLGTRINLYKNGNTLLESVYIHPNTHKSIIMSNNIRLTPADYLTMDLQATGGSDLLFTAVYYAVIYSAI
jgi:hypothetical protein